ncbi:hypothetical protein GWK47_004634 [Chionoecetes opilio]|uniref:Uncharacterized protein n=1 Tax=Chionoecetes opilio TaxID=41210 RepID=A0A8J4YCP6_CHIOP|nr:hypothetical protein GWK47_004634 [Chionoecetes opilio]
MRSNLHLGGGSCSVTVEVQRGTVKTKNLWRSRRRWAQAAAMEIFECVDCFQSRPRVRVRQPRPPSESPPPPYSLFNNSDPLRPEDDAPSEDSDSHIIESQETGGTNLLYATGEYLHFLHRFYLLSMWFFCLLIE